MSAVTVRVATASEKPLIDGLMQFYIYDWSEMEPPESTAFDVGANGLFAPFPGLADYWTTPDHVPLLIQLGAATVGFALLNTHSHLTGSAIARNMAEFFVMRQHRRQGVAMAAVGRILAAYPGDWEIAIATRNVKAIAFWPRAIGAAANVRDLREAQGDGAHWNGPIWCFRAV